MIERRRWTRQQRMVLAGKVLILRANGYKLEVIALKLAVNPSVVCRILSKYGRTRL